MTMVATPPVNEVVVSISLQPQPVLEGPRLIAALSPILAEFPQVTEVVPYEMAIEETPEEQLLRPATPQIQVVLPTQIRHRYWLTQSDNSALLLQVQSDYFALNWRRQDGGDSYPGFEELTRHFQTHLEKFEASIIGHGGERLWAKQLELTYINILRPSQLWGSIKNLNQVINLSIPGMERFEELNLAFSEPVFTTAGEFYGRLHAAVSTGYQPKSEPAELRPLRMADMTPVINLSITTRSSIIDERAANVSPRFDLAHDVVTSAFRRLTTGSAQVNWGLL